MSTWLVETREECKVDEECAIVRRSDNGVLAKVHGEVLVEEGRVNSLVEVHTMSSNLEGINSPLFVLPVEDVVVEELVRLGGNVDTIASEFVSDLRELMPVSSLPLSRGVFVRQ